MQIEEKLFTQLKTELALYDVASVAKAAGCSQATLYFWLDGTTKCPHLRTFCRVADALGLELSLAHRRAFAQAA